MKIVLSLALAAAVFMATASANSLSKRSGPGAHWDYGADKAGPSHWSLLDPTYVTCDKGLQQSPIDINADTLRRFVSCATKPLTFDYKPLKDSVAHFNGHTVEVDWTPSATAHNNSITIGKKEYNLIQFHFHTPSEHRINGRHADAELHLVHRSPVDQSLAVIGVLLQAQAKNVPFFKYLIALRKKVHAHQAQHVLHLEDGLSNVIADVIEDDFAASIEDAEFEDEVDGDELVDGGEDAEGDEEQDEQGYEFNNAEAEYNAEDETDFASQAFDAEPSEDEKQVDINASIVETIALDNLDKNKNKDKDSQNINNQNNNDNKQNKKSQQDLFVFNDNNESNNNNGDNNQDSQDTNSAYAPSSSPEEILSSEAAEKCNLPPTADGIICAGIPPTDEEAIHVELPLKSVDFSALIKTTKGLTFRWEYSGSLTTPPCSEHVAWNVMHEPFPIGLEQLRALVDLQGYNARQINEDQQAKREPVA
ncbi:MAG: alpha carbonic anhydrase [Linnemannia gamsii]|nr:MAG: alpha carbonic anhydrase [Linnemannia gamsii]